MKILPKQKQFGRNAWIAPVFKKLKLGDVLLLHVLCSLLGLEMKKEVNYRKISRSLALRDGAYDGRFREKVVKDKKKESSKKACRKRVEY